MDVIFSKYRRGQVWFVKNRDSVSDKFYSNGRHDSVTAKNRPFLIVSNNVNNENSTTLNCVPITTKAKDHLPCHVYYYDNYNRRDQQIQTEQITTIPATDFVDYMYTLSDDTMKRVNAALANQVGVELGLDVVDNLLEYVDQLIDRKMEVLKNARIKSNERIVSDTALQIKSRISEMMKESIKEAIEVTEKDSAPIAISTPEVIEERNTDESNTPDETTAVAAPTPKKRGGRPKKVTTEVINTSSSDESKTEGRSYRKSGNSWTEENMKAYLNDYKTLPIDDLISKWNIKDRKTAVTYRGVFERKLGLR